MKLTKREFEIVEDIYRSLGEFSDIVVVCPYNFICTWAIVTYRNGTKCIHEFCFQRSQSYSYQPFLKAKTRLRFVKGEIKPYTK